MWKEHLVTLLRRYFPRLMATWSLLRKDSWLQTTGWLQSFRLRKAVDAQGEPIPWMTYAFVKFLEPRVHSDWWVCEYGAGHSTLWWGKRVEKVFAVEHNRRWCAYLQSRISGNVRLQLVDPNRYVDVPMEYVRQVGRKFDICVIDGIKREQCLRTSIHLIHEQGVIVLECSTGTIIVWGFR